MNMPKALARQPRHLPLLVVFILGLLLISLTSSRIMKERHTFQSIEPAGRLFSTDRGFQLPADAENQFKPYLNERTTLVLASGGLLCLLWLGFYLRSMLQQLDRLHQRFNQVALELKRSPKDDHTKMKSDNIPPVIVPRNADLPAPQPTQPGQDQLKMLLKMTGSTAHGLNQPLMALLGNIELMQLDIHDPEKLVQHMTEVNEAGRRIAELVKRLQTVNYDKLQPKSKGTAALNFDHELKILSVEDTDTDFSAINSILEAYDQVKLIWAKSIEEAIASICSQKFDLVFLDYMLPDGNGLEFLKKMNQHQISIPVVVITGQGDEIIASQIIRAGAYDYLPKSNINSKSLTRIINNTVEKYRLKQEVNLVMKKMAEMSIRDELTDLYNRRFFEEALRREMDIAKRYDQPMTLCMMDLDHFKQINDTHGHPAGDMVLKEFGRMLKKSIRSSDVACRFGGEEFCLVLPKSRIEEARILCERFRKMVAEQRFHFDGKDFHVTVSMGIAAYDIAQGMSPEKLVQAADDAMYLAKQKGRNLVQEMSLAA